MERIAALLRERQFEQRGGAREEGTDMRKVLSPISETRMVPVCRHRH
jgi:hypothetical protein